MNQKFEKGDEVLTRNPFTHLVQEATVTGEICCPTGIVVRIRGNELSSCVHAKYLTLVPKGASLAQIDALKSILV